MEVLKTGMKNTVTCGNCESQLRYSDADLYAVKGHVNFGPYEIDIEPEDSYKLYVGCPVCRTPVHVSSATRSLKAKVIKAENDREMRRDHDL